MPPEPQPPAAPTPPAAPPSAPPSAPPNAPPAGPTPSYTPPAWASDWEADDLQLAQAKAWESPGDVLRAYKGAAKFLGAPAEELVRWPENPSPEQLATIRQRLGVPEQPDGYDFGDLAPVEGGPDLFTPFRGWAHELGLPKEAAKGLAEKFTAWQNEQATAQAEAYQNDAQAAQQTLQAKLGREGYAALEQAANSFARAIGLDAETAVMLQSVLGAEKLLTTFGQLGQRLGEHRVTEGQSAGGGYLTPAGALEKAKALQADPAFLDKEHPQHAAIAAQYHRLMQIAYPEPRE